MNWLAHEWTLLWRSRPSAASLLLLMALATWAVVGGIQEVGRQSQAIERLGPLQEQDVAAVASRYADSGNAGSAAYYTFYSTWDPPSSAAFAALGLRDVAPFMLRIRALGLQAQLYEGEHFNPELALAGRFDFSFVLIYLAPLFVIVLLHDLVSSEREQGRLRMLLSLQGAHSLWRRRIALRYALLLACLAIPLSAGAAFTGSGLLALAVMLLVVASYLAFWCGLSWLIVRQGWGSSTNATILMSAWVLLTLVLPTLANVALVRTIPVHQGVDLMLAQREAVHGAWEIPREDTMRHFLASHPQWQDTAPLPAGFHWKWYFAFHQLGDESVAEQARAYRQGLLARQAWTERLGAVLPGVGAQAMLHRMADTDLPAQLAYQDRIAAFHAQIRAFYYAYLFHERPFRAADFQMLPQFTPRARPQGLQFNASWLMVALGWMLFLAGTSRPLRNELHV